MRAKLSNLQSIPQVVAEMTLDEKLDMVGCYRACHTRPIPDMDVPAIYLMDGATGLNGTHVVLDYLTDPCRADDPRTAYATPEMVALNRVDLNEAAAKYKGDALMTDLVEQAAKYRPGGRQHISFPSGICIPMTPCPRSCRCPAPSRCRSMRIASACRDWSMTMC